jgi:hypothetical protein
VRPCRDYTPDGFQRKSAKRWAWRSRRVSNRLRGLQRALMRELGYDNPPPVPVYPQLARKAWR